MPERDELEPVQQEDHKGASWRKILAVVLFTTAAAGVLLRGERRQPVNVSNQVDVVANTGDNDYHDNVWDFSDGAETKVTNTVDLNAVTGPNLEVSGPGNNFKSDIELDLP